MDMESRQNSLRGFQHDRSGTAPNGASEKTVKVFPKKTLPIHFSSSLLQESLL